MINPFGKFSSFTKGMITMKNVKWKIGIFLSIFFLMWINHTISYATDNEVLESQKKAVGIPEFIEEAEDYTKETLEGTGINPEEVLNEAIEGNLNHSKLIGFLFKILGNEVKNAVTTVGIILVIIVIHSILKSISDGLENQEISKVIFYVEYILIVTLIMANFADIIKMAVGAISSLVDITNLLIPILITLMITTGSIVSAGVVQPVLLFAVSFIGNIINSLIVPILMISTVLSIISNISDKVQIGKLSKFFKSSVVWTLGVLLTLFVGILSLEGSLSSSVDGITAKTVKAATSTVIPVVGKVLGDSVDTVLGCAGILKNACGVLGVVIIIAICAMPIIKLSILTAVYKLAGAAVEPIADEKIVKLLEQMGDTFKILLAILFSVSTLLIIGITIVIKISNSSMMYR